MAELLEQKLDQIMVERIKKGLRVKPFWGKSCLQKIVELSPLLVTENDLALSQLKQSPLNEHVDNLNKAMASEATTAELLQEALLNVDKEIAGCAIYKIGGFSRKDKKKLASVQTQLKQLLSYSKNDYRKGWSKTIESKAIKEIMSHWIKLGFIEQAWSFSGNKFKLTDTTNERLQQFHERLV